MEPAREDIEAAQYATGELNPITWTTWIIHDCTEKYSMRQSISYLYCVSRRQCLRKELTNGSSIAAKKKKLSVVPLKINFFRHVSKAQLIKGVLRVLRSSEGGHRPPPPKRHRGVASTGEAGHTLGLRAEA